MSEYDFTYYQSEAAKTAVYRESCPDVPSRLMYTVLGLTSETGEVADKLKKLLRDNNGYELLRNFHNSELTQDQQLSLATFRNSLEKELGDCLWYIANIARELNLDLHMVMLGNLNKLQSRQKRNVLKGSGDDR